MTTKKLDKTFLSLWSDNNWQMVRANSNSVRIILTQKVADKGLIQKELCTFIYWIISFLLSTLIASLLVIQPLDLYYEEVFTAISNYSCRMYA